MSNFTYQPSPCIPWKLDPEVYERVRNIRREEITNHPNPDFKINVVPDDFVELIWVTDIFHRIKRAAEEGSRVVMIMPNPARAYRKVAYLINKFRVDCKHVYTFIMDEYADQDGNIAPPDWPWGFMYAFKKFFYEPIDDALKPPEDHLVGPTNANIGDYGNMIEDLGGADICYSGPGWTGHLAFIEPDAPEFQANSLEEWKQMGARVVTLSPFTIAQNSLHGFFGKSGDLAKVPPKAATIGPAEVIAAKHRIDFNALTTAGTNVSWQRFVSRLWMHGPVTPTVPTSILQTLRTDVYISETIAQNVEPDWEFEY